MSSTPRRTNAATAVAVVLAVLLAIVWLRSPGDAAPAVPSGLPVTAGAPAVARLIGCRPTRPGWDREGEGMVSAGSAHASGAVTRPPGGR